MWAGCANGIVSIGYMVLYTTILGINTFPPIYHL
jgi:hypothetical protein